MNSTNDKRSNYRKFTDAATERVAVTDKLNAAKHVPNYVKDELIAAGASNQRILNVIEEWKTRVNPENLIVGDVVKVTYMWEGAEYFYYATVTDRAPRIADEDLPKKTRANITGVNVIMETDNPDDKPVVGRLYKTDIVERCHSCECGNPYTICHPDA